MKIKGGNRLLRYCGGVGFVFACFLRDCYDAYFFLGR